MDIKLDDFNLKMVNQDQEDTEQSNTNHYGNQKSHGLRIYFLDHDRTNNDDNDDENDNGVLRTNEELIKIIEK